MSDGTKVCRVCKHDKPIDEFYVVVKASGRRRTICKSCEREKAKQAYGTPEGKLSTRNSPSSRKRWGDGMANYLDIQPDEY